MKFRTLSFVALSALVLFSGYSCRKKEEKPAPSIGKLSVVATLFPNYDFAKNIGGDRAEVTLLLPPGVEPHAFEPKPEDIIRIQKADILIYTGKFMEPWVEDLLKGIDSRKLIVVDASKGIALLEEKEEEPAHGHGHDEDMDPHIWLDLERAQSMAGNILEGFIRADSAGKELYTKNAEQYRIRLSELDKKFKEGLAGCKTRVFIHGGHFAFGYLAKRYDLKYLSAYEGFSPDAEPSPRKLTDLVKKLRQHGLRHVFYEELVSPKTAQTIAKEAGATLLQLHASHNLTKDEWDKGATFIGLMEGNLNNLRTGIQCR